MRRPLFILSLLLVTAPAAAQGTGKQRLGIFFGWGAFAEREPRKCYAIARPHNLPDRLKGAYAAVGYWPERGLRSQLHIRLSRPKRPGTAIILRIGERSFQLAGGGADAWAPDGRTDAAIAAAMRTVTEMSVEARSANGRLFRDRYHLRGAASAIDAAAIACARR